MAENKRVPVPRGRGRRKLYDVSSIPVGEWKFFPHDPKGHISIINFRQSIASACSKVAKEENKKFVTERMEWDEGNGEVPGVMVWRTE